MSVSSFEKRARRIPHNNFIDPTFTDLKKLKKHVRPDILIFEFFQNNLDLLIGNKCKLLLLQSYSVSPLR